MNVNGHLHVQTERYCLSRTVLSWQHGIVLHNIHMPCCSVMLVKCLQTIRYNINGHLHVQTDQYCLGSTVPCQYGTVLHKIHMLCCSVMLV